MSGAVTKGLYPDLTMKRMPRPAMRTFLFSDLRDYTAFIETRGDEAATKMLRASRRIVRDAVAKHRGAEIKTEGDSFYVVFHSPSPAVLCAIDIQRGAAAHTARHPDVPVRMGIGINTGEAMPHDKGYVGSAVIVATRLSTSSKAGQILVTDTVRSLVRTGAHAPMRDVGAWTLKGVAEPVHVYEVDSAVAPAHRALGPALSLPAMLASPATSTPGLVVCPDLVQRDEAIAALTYHVEAAARGEAPIVAISGEGGIGKSRLVREVADAAHREGHYVFGGRSHSAGPPYEPIIAALRPYAHARGTEILRRLLGPLVVELRRLLPEFEVGDARADTDVSSEERRERFLRTINLLLEDAASQRPVLLVLEDFHDADEATRDLVRYLASTFRAGMCLVLIYRDEEVTPAHPLRALLAELERERRLARVVLIPLDLAGVERMTTALVPGRDGSLAQAVFERSQGVPFYVEELLKTALDEPNARPDDLALPRTIADSVRLRVSRLVAERGPSVADLIEAAALAEVPLGYDTLVKLSDRPEAEAGADLAAAIEAQLLERPPTRTELYQFRHALTREAVAAGIPPARRRRLHARVAEAVESRGDVDVRAAFLARHFSAAGDRAKALAYARRGATNAVRVGAYPTAIDLLHEAVAMAAGTPDEIDVIEELAVALRRAGRAAEAEAAIARARDIARAASDRDAVARLDVALAGVLRIQGRRDEAMAAVSRAVTSLKGERNEGVARALATLAELHWAEQDAERAIAVAEEALPIAREVRAIRTIVAALTVLGAAQMRLGAQEGRARLEEAIALADEHEMAVEAVDALFELARAELLLGNIESARRGAEAALTLARERGLELAQARLLPFLTTLAINDGRYRDARGLAEQAVALARPGTTAEGAAKIGLANLLVTTGDPQRALSILDQVETQFERLEPDRRELWYSYRALALMGVGRGADAKAAARSGLEVTQAMRRQGMTTFLCAAEVAEALRDRDWIEEIARTFDAYFVDRDTAPIRATRSEIAAVLALCRGDEPAADFERAAAEWAVLGARGRSTYRRASSLIAQLDDIQRRTDARKELEHLRDLLSEWGALRYVRAIDVALDRPFSTPTTGELLSQDELRVAFLVSSGVTDAKIAAELDISTAEALRRVVEVLDKLGVKSRSQLASWAVTHNAPADPVPATAISDR